MADAAVLREFLITLGFKIDESSGSKFTNTIVRATSEIVAFATAVEGAAALVVKSVATMADQLEDLYFASKRTGASAENIRNFGFAAERLGSSVAGARGSLEAFRNFLGSTPGAGGLLRSFGIDPSQDPTKVLEQFGSYLRTLPEFMQRLRGEQFGLDWHTTLALVSGDFARIQGQAEALDKRQGVGGGFLEAATKSAHEFNNQITLLFRTFDNLRIRVAAVLQDRLSVDISRFTELVTKNFDRITMTVDTIARGILWAGDVLLQAVAKAADVFSTLSNWYNELSPQTQQFIKDLVLLAGGFFIVNTVLKMNPFIALAAAIIALIEDYQKWKQGAEHFIDWDKWDPELQKAYTQFKEFMKWVDGIVEKIGGWKTVLEVFAIFLATTWLSSLVATFGAAAAALSPLTLALSAAIAAAVAVNKLIGNDQAREWIYKNIPGSSAASDWMARHTMFGRTYEEQQQAEKKLYPQGGGPEALSINKPNAGLPLTGQMSVGQIADAFWGFGSSAGNWMRNSFDRLIENTDKMLSALISPAQAGEWPGEAAPGPAYGSGPAPPPTTTAEVRARAMALMDRLQRDLGITREGAAADVGNAAAESGIRSIPTGLAPQTSTSAFGMWQFTGSRRVARDTFARMHPELSPEEVDIQFHESELQTKFPDLLNKMRQQGRTFSGLAHDFFNQYESGGAPSLAQYEGGHTAYGQAFYSGSMGSPLAPSATVPATSAAPAGNNVPSMLRIESTLNVHGVHDPRTVSDIIMQEYDRHNLEAIRNAQSAVR